MFLANAQNPSIIDSSHYEGFFIFSLKALMGDGKEKISLFSENLETYKKDPLIKIRV